MTLPVGSWVIAPITALSGGVSRVGCDRPEPRIKQENLIRMQKQHQDMAFDLDAKPARMSNLQLGTETVRMRFATMVALGAAAESHQLGIKK